MDFSQPHGCSARVRTCLYDHGCDADCHRGDGCHHAGTCFAGESQHIPRPYLLPVILCFCVIDRMLARLFDVWVMLGFASCSCWNRSPLAPFIISFVLGHIAGKPDSGLQVQWQFLPSSPSLFAPVHRDRRYHAVRTTGEITIQFTAGGGAMKKSTVIWTRCRHRDRLSDWLADHASQMETTESGYPNVLFTSLFRMMLVEAATPLYGSWGNRGRCTGRSAAGHLEPTWRLRHHRQR